MPDLELSQELGSNAEAEDEFASGPDNRTRRLARRVAAGIFAPPYLPSALTWLVLALVASNAAARYLSALTKAGLDEALSSGLTPFARPLVAGWWGLPIYLGYLLLAALLLSLLNARAAFVPWFALSLYHVWDITAGFTCGAVYYLPIENLGNCAQVHSGALMLGGLLWATALLLAGRLGLLAMPGLAAEKTAPPAWLRRLPQACAAWMLLVSAGTAFAFAAAPRPTWRLVQAAHSPVGRTDASLTYDTRRSVAVLFGGITGWTVAGGWDDVGDTWEWDGDDWKQMKPTLSPSVRYDASLAYDEHAGLTVLFGGMSQEEDGRIVYHDDTWQWDGHEWREVRTTLHPPARAASSLFYDPLRRALILQGGFSKDPETYNDVFLEDAWVWDGKAWSQLELEQPRRTSSTTLIFDDARQMPLLMDGEGLWYWQGDSWNQPSFDVSPPPRWGGQMAAFPSGGPIVLFGGNMNNQALDDTWILEGASWFKTVTSAQPPKRGGGRMFYDSARDRLMLFGGQDGGTFYGDLWEFERP